MSESLGNQPYEKKTYYGMTLDPVHIGTGGYRLGRVDNTIIREPGTNLPKIPGSSIAGVARAYTAMAVQSANPLKMKYLRERCIEVTGEDGKKIPKVVYESCAGKGGEDGDAHCGKPDCEVCISYGFSRRSSGSFQGMAQFYDARILFFPVHSMAGPVWITTESGLRDFSEAAKQQPTLTVDLEADLRIPEGYEVMTAQAGPEANVNLGWLYVKNWKKVNALRSPIPGLDKAITEHVALVSESLFSQLVNDNLEVRTSVAIDPATGAAEDGALYTYEAIPRATILWFDVLYNKPEYFGVRVDGAAEKIRHNQREGEGWRWIKENAERGLAMMEALGLGGMNTRGMGRLKILNLGG